MYGWKIQIALLGLACVLVCQQGLAQSRADLPPLEQWIQWRGERLVYHQTARVSPVSISDQIVIRKGGSVSIAYRSNSPGNWVFDTTGEGDIRIDYDGTERLTIMDGGRKISLPPATTHNLNDDASIRWDYALPYRDKASIFVYDTNHGARQMWGKLQRWFEYQDSHRFRGRFQTAESPSRQYVGTAIGQNVIKMLLGHWVSEIYGVKVRIPVYVDNPDFDDEDQVFIAITDETSGQQTPAVGRYLADVTIADLKEDVVVLDFNYLHNPYCTVSRLTNCPLLEDSHVGIEILAGERMPIGTFNDPPASLAER